MIPKPEIKTKPELEDEFCNVCQEKVSEDQIAVRRIKSSPKKIDNKVTGKEISQKVIICISCSAKGYEI